MNAVLTRRAAARGLLSAISLTALATAAEAAVVQGRVTDQTATISLEGAIIRIEELGASTITGQDGRFRFQNVPAGDYTLSVSYQGAESVAATVNVTEEEVVDQLFRLGEDLAVVDNILVVGQLGSLASSLSQQRAADNLISVLSADAIGQFPDQNVSEAARRISGLSVANDQGEGRFVIIRGIDPNLNSTSINGVRVPSPEGDIRAVALDVIDSDVLNGIEVTKSLTPDLDGDAIGGSINIKTLSAFDRDGAYLNVKAQGSYNELSEELSPGLALTASDIFMDGRLGVAGSISWRRRNFSSDNKEADDAAWDSEDGIFFPEELELRNYDILRERINASLNVDFKASENTNLYVRGLFSDFRDQEFRSRVEAKLADGEFDSASSSGTVAIFRAGLDDDSEEFGPEFDRDIKDREETQQIISVSIGGESYVDNWTFEYSGAYSHSEEEEPNRLDTDFRSTFDSVDDGFGFGADTADTILPRLAFADAASAAAYVDPSNYEFDGAEVTNGLTEDDEWSFKADARYDTFLGSFPTYLKFGGKARFRDKERDVELEIYDGFDGDDITLAQFATTVDYPLDTFGPAPDPSAVRAFFNDNISSFELDGDDSLIESNIADYTASENIYAGYLMGRIDLNDLRVVTGVRLESTTFEATGNAVNEVDEGATVNGVVLDDDAILISENSIRDSYLDWFPSVNLRYELSDEIVLRGAYYKSIARPNISSAVPAAAIAQDEDNEIEAEIGNPDIERQRADNLDASVAIYPGKNTVISAGVFYKSIDNFIARQTVQNLTAFGVTFDEAVLDVNLADAELVGVEVNYQQAFSFLPSPWDGLIVGANYTHVDGDATLNDGRSIPLPQQSANIANISLGYDKGRLDIRGALTYRDEYLDEINFAGDGLDRIVDDHLQWDVSAKVKITDQFTAFAEATNLSDEPFVAFIRQDGQRLLSQYEEYGYTVTFGLRFKY